MADRSQLQALEALWHHADCLADEATVQAAIDRLATEITAALADKLPVVYVVMNGGLIFAGQLLPRLRFPLEVAYLHATRYGNATQGGEIAWRVQPTAVAAGRHVLVIDDILDEGYTLSAIMERLQADGAASVALAVLCDKAHDRKVRPGWRADFTGLTIPDRFVFGFGMDYQGFWRNAPGIYALPQQPSLR